MLRWLWVFIGAAGSSLLLPLSLPPIDAHLLAWFCLVPVLIATRRAGFLPGLVGGLLVGGFAYIWISEGWLIANTRPDGDHGWTRVGLILFSAAIAGVTTVWACQKQIKPLTIFALAAVGVLAEAGLLIVLPAHIALSQYRQPGMLMLASATGIWGVSYLLYAANLWLASALASLRFLQILFASVGIVMVAITAHTIRTVAPLSGQPEWRVAAIQTRAGDLDSIAKIVDYAYREPSKPHLIVWPELSAIAIAHGGQTQPLRDFTYRYGTFVTTFRDDAKPMPHNAAALFHVGTESERYFKRKPFGGEKNDHAPGTKAVAVKHREVSIGLNICFDSCFPSVIRETALLPGVALIALPTLDPESPNGFVEAIHAAFTPFRSAELGVPIVRAEAAAYSMITDATGRIVAEMEFQEDASIEATVKLGPRATIYKRFGDWFVWFSLLLAAYAVIVAVRGRPKSQDVTAS